MISNPDEDDNRCVSNVNGNAESHTQIPNSTYNNGDSQSVTSTNTEGLLNPVNLEEHQCKATSGTITNGNSSLNSKSDLLIPPHNLDSQSNAIEEPIYAESTKRKKPDGNADISDNQKAIITVMAARTQENNRTFYLSSPDSAVSTQWSPKDASNPAFIWPEMIIPNSSNNHKPQSSPPVPPKTSSRPPRLGASSLSSAPLLQLSFHAVLPPKDVGLDSRRSVRSLDKCIDEVDEESEGCSINAPAVRDAGEWQMEERATPGTANKSSSHTLNKEVESSRDTPGETLESGDPAPPPPPPKKHHRVCSMDQQGSVENLSQSLRGLNCCTNASSDSLQALSDADSTLRSSPSPFPSSPFGSAPASPQPSSLAQSCVFPSNSLAQSCVFPSNSLAHQLQPPPLPQKKLVNRTISAPSDVGVKPLSRSRLHLPFSGSETNISRPAATAQPSNSLCSSSESLDNATSSSTSRLHALLPPTAAGSTLQLHALLSNMDSREGIYSKLGGLYAESLRRLALKCEEHFTGGHRNTLRFNESNWSLFKLTCNKPSCLSGDAVYYSASCASDTRNTYAVKICKGQTSDSKQTHLYGLSVQQSIPPHFNLQQDCGHFIACVPQSMLPTEENTPAAAAPPTEQERVVVITRDVPHQTVADFVRDWESFHRAQPEVYERRVCFLLLQLCTGLEHLKAHGVTHRDLCMENLLLIQHRQSADPQQQSLPRLVISSFAKAKRRNNDEIAISADPRFKRDHARLAPEIVSAAQYRKFDEFQTGILIYELLHRRNPFESTPALRQYKCDELPPIPSVSLYSCGLHRLAQLLLEPDPGRRIHIQEAKRVLQALLWGPRRDLLEQPWVCGSVRRHTHGRQDGLQHTHAQQDGLLNWLDVKRALLMMKFAERSLEPQRNAELEDWLCCQYFSSANPRALCQTAELLYNTTFTH